MHRYEQTLESAAHLIAAMRDRPDRIASALSLWLERHKQPLEQLQALLGCAPAVLERLALVPRPQPGRDWEDDVEIIAISLRLRHDALRMILCEAEQPREREFGA